MWLSKVFLYDSVQSHCSSDKDLQSSWKKHPSFFQVIGKEYHHCTVRLIFRISLHRVFSALKIVRQYWNSYWAPTTNSQSLLIKRLLELLLHECHDLCRGWKKKTEASKGKMILSAWLKVHLFAPLLYKSGSEDHRCKVHEKAFLPFIIKKQESCYTILCFHYEPHYRNESVRLNEI